MHAFEEVGGKRRKKERGEKRTSNPCSRNGGGRGRGMFIMRRKRGEEHSETSLLFE